MDTANVNNCFPLDLRPFSSDLNPKKKRSKLLRVDPPNPNPIPKANMSMPCTECGKTFWSSKALFGHMRCHPERQWRGIKPPPNFGPPPAVTEEDHEVVASLLILAKGTEYSNSGGYRFECSSCKKVFGSHQALGGHRASHKNVKGCYANTKKEEEEEGCCKYKCSVCFRVFSTGQALGGHKRCHWDKMDIASTGFQFDFNLNFPAAQNHHPSNSSYSSGLPDLDLRLGL